MYVYVHGSIMHDSQKGNNPYIHQLMNEWVNVLSKQWNSIHSEEGNNYWLCYRMNESWKHMPSERSQTQKPHTIWFHWYEMSRTGKSVKQKTVDLLLLGDVKGIFNLGWWSFPELVMMIVQSCAYIENIQLYIFTMILVSTMWILFQNIF